MRMKTVKKQWLPLILILALIFLVTAPLTATAPDFLTLGGGTSANPLQMDVYADGSMSLWFWQDVVFDPNTGTEGFQHQYYGDPGDWSWNTNIHFTDGATKYHVFTPDSLMYTTDPDYNATLTPVPLGIGTQVASGNSVTTTWTLHSGALQLVQTVTYIPGSYYVEKDFVLTNLSDKTFTDVNLIHGGDTYFGGDDDSYSYFDATNRMVYIRNEDMTTFGLMGYSGGATSPADHYFVGYYWDGGQLAANGLLNDFVLSEEKEDAGYQLEWDRPSLAPAESLSIVSYERITGASPVQVLAPAEKDTLPGTNVTYSFVLQNFGDTAADFTLLPTSEHGWPVTVTGGNSVNLPSLGTPINIEVVVTVPAGTAAGTADLVTLLATKTSDPGIFASGSTRTNVTAPPPAITGVTPGTTQLVLGAVALPVTVNTVSLPHGTPIQVQLLDGSGNSLVPPITGTGTVDDGDGDGVGQALVTLVLPDNLPLANYRIQVTVPESPLVNNDAGIAIVAPSPTPTPTPVPVAVPDTGESASGLPLIGALALIAVALASTLRFRFRKEGET